MGFMVRKSSKYPYRLIEQVYTPKKTEKVIPRESYISFGFNPSMSIEEAKKRASQLNKQNELERKKMVDAARRIENDKQIDFAYLPKSAVSSFEAQLKKLYSDNESRLNNIMKQWTIVQKMLSKLALDPVNYGKNQDEFYLYYREKKWGPDYIKKLNWLLNQWGAYYCKKNGQFYDPVKKLTLIQREKINDLREDLPGKKGPADPLKWEKLKAVKSTFANEDLILKWNWMFIALWFGLRPVEMGHIKNGKHFKIENDFEHKIKVLQVYQSKLVSKPKAERWKTIPVFFEEQKEALRLIESGDFERPLNKTLKRLIADKIETYSPRKGFTDLMLIKGFSLEDISIFLGHADISMTWKHYKNKKTFKLPG